MVQVDDVDRVDRGVGVGVGRQQNSTGHRVDVHRLFEELDAAHLRHPVVGDEHCHGFAAQLQFVDRFQRVEPGFGADDPIPLAVVAAEVTCHGTRDGGVVVHGENHGFAGLGGAGPVITVKYALVVQCLLGWALRARSCRRAVFASR